MVVQKNLEVFIKYLYNFSEENFNCFYKLLSYRYPEISINFGYFIFKNLNKNNINNKLFINFFEDYYTKYSDTFYEIIKFFNKNDFLFENIFKLFLFWKFKSFNKKYKNFFVDTKKQVILYDVRLSKQIEKNFIIDLLKRLKELKNNKKFILLFFDLFNINKYFSKNVDETIKTLSEVLNIKILYKDKNFNYFKKYKEHEIIYYNGNIDNKYNFMVLNIENIYFIFNKKGKVLIKIKNNEDLQNLKNKIISKLINKNFDFDLRKIFYLYLNYF